MNEIPITEITSAYKLISPHIFTTPLRYVPGENLFIKWENQQETGSFKARGAFNKMLQLEPTLRENGVIAASAGNHGQGVALAGQKTNTPVTVYTYSGAPQVKITAMKNYGAEVIVVDGGYTDAENAGILAAEKENRLYVSPYNDRHIIAGQGTIALEIVAQLKKEHQLEDLSKSVWFVPVSGGGLLSGVAIAVRSLVPDAVIIGVQPENSPYMHQLFRGGTQKNVLSFPTIADSLDGGLDNESSTIPIIMKMVDSIQLLSENDMMDAIAYAWNEFGQRIEASGAISIAAALEYSDPNVRKMAIVTGGNIQDELFDKIIGTYA